MTGTHKYDYIGQFINGIAIVRKDNLYGAILAGGRELIVPIYDYLSHFENGYSKAIKNGNPIIVDLSGIEYIETSHGLFEIPHDIYCIQECGTNLYRFAIRIDKSQYYRTPELKWGVMNENKEIIVNPEFDYIHDYICTTTKACKITHHNYKDSVEWFVITEKSVIGQETFEIEPAIIDTDELILTRVRPNYSGTYHSDNKEKYFSIRTNSSCVAIVYFNGQRYTLDKEVYRVLPLCYGHHIVQNRHGKFGAVDRCGRNVSPFEYYSANNVLYPHIITLPSGREISLPKDITKIYPFEGEYAKFISSKGMGVLDNNGNIIAKDLPYYIASYNEIYSSFLLHRSKDNTNWIGLLDVKRKRIISPNYNRICSYVADGATVEINDFGTFKLNKLGQCMIVNYGIEVALPNDFPAGLIPQNNISIVTNGNKWGLYDIEQHNILVNCEYQQIVFHNFNIYIAKKISYISQPNKWGEKQPDIEHIRYSVFDKTGKMILTDLESVSPISDVKFIISQNGLYGVINNNNEVLIQCENISIDDLGYNRVSAINKDKQLRILDYDGNLITERFILQYSSIKVYPFEKNKRAKVQWLDYTGYMDIEGNLLTPYKEKYVPVPVGYDWCFDFNGKSFRCLKNFSDIEFLKKEFINLYEIGTIVQANNEIVIYTNGKLAKVPNEITSVLYTSKSFSIVGITQQNEDDGFYNYKFGIIDKSGEWYFEPMSYPKFDCLTSSILIINGHGHPSRKALLNHKKGIITDFRYIEVEFSKNNKAIIASVIDEVFSKSKKWNEKDRYTIELLDENFKVLASFENSRVSSQILVENQCFFIIEDNANHKYGVVNDCGEIIIPIKYSYLRQFDSKSFEVGLTHNCKGLIGFNGDIITPIEYSTIIKNSTDSYIGIERLQTPDGYNLLF